MGAGPLEVACTNMEVTIKEAEGMSDHLQGSNGWFSSEKYLATVMRHPAAARIVKVAVPADKKQYGSRAGSQIPVVTYVVYPTRKDNPRPSYTFPYTNTGDNVFTHMQAPGEKPIFAEAGARYPLIVYSHGYQAHGLWELDRFKRLASHGFIVVSIFHGDGRFSGPDNVALRPLQFRQVLDQLLADPDFGPAIDSSRIGASGSSFGGMTILSCMGGGTSGESGCAPDARIKAGFGLVPFTGAFWARPFGKDWASLKGVRVPYLAVYAEADSNVPPDTVLGSIAQCSGDSTAVALPGEKHILSQDAWVDVKTWELLFFNAWLKGDAQALALLQGDTRVRGGVADHKTYHQDARP
jgi:predicted dienelactone hydrolase